jgi:predicted tellurium resistance membrane protein TerC
MDFVTPLFWIALLQIIGVNIVLSGDNAVVIALAARSLPDKQRKQAVVIGSGAAVLMRIILTMVAVEILQLAFRISSSSGRCCCSGSGCSCSPRKATTRTAMPGRRRAA